MMKLRHLFDNRALAEMLVKNWDYDEPSLEMFQYFRISANAIYPFRKNGEICLLRFCPTSEKPKASLLAELEFIHYLRDAQYNALEPVPSNSGDELVQKQTPWGEYYASVFKRVKGKQISESNLNDEVLSAYGSMLGQLHKISSTYTAPKTRRWTHVEVFDWIEANLRNLASESSPIDELNLLRKYFSDLPKDPGNYGLIHYDFEADNVFYDDATRSCSVIDFDDAMYHWYIMDIVQAIYGLRKEFAEHEFSRKQAIFLDSYRNKFEIDNQLLAAMPIFRRFANLFRYTRDLRALQEHWENEPEWLVELRAKLTAALVDDAEFFGKAIVVSGC